MIRPAERQAPLVLEDDAKSGAARFRMAVTCDHPIWRRFVAAVRFGRAVAAMDGAAVQKLGREQWRWRRSDERRCDVPAACQAAAAAGGQQRHRQRSYMPLRAIMYVQLPGTSTGLRLHRSSTSEDTCGDAPHRLSPVSVA